jgi:hypothetical protein
MVSRRAVVATAGSAVVVAATGWFAFRRPAATADRQGITALGTAPVVRTTVIAREVVTGTVGYLNPVGVVCGGGGVLTWLPMVGAIVGADQPLYEVDGQPVVLWLGARPAWRDLTPGMPAGADVAQAEQNLGAKLTSPALRRWQAAHGLAQTGVIRLGQVVFQPGPVRIASLELSIGTPLRPGLTVLTATSTTKAVSVNLDPNRQTVVRKADKVTIALPTGGSTTGTVTAVGAPVAQESPDHSRQTVALPVTVGFDDPAKIGGLDAGTVQVSIATAERANVLAVPIDALLAAPGGGYQVAVVSGTQRKVMNVHCGLFDEASGLVEVDGQLEAGMRVEVPAT